ncbi:PVC-type heme-binding CxxCH protein [Frigoriglobus tundricola]|uniref:Beta-propeller-type glycoside hydrolase n=1 Tax=Frigoriglobus tundricola TaxID=2774151 RepID=A0A6M5YZQ3_9BACT|nr:PVC-type heme-binding CxxCH protein [Frigoriglobus tundricola]QJW99014.1 beta-propeller-type glycoside hydrolase [Frigoriglobus tundricola]
MRTISLAALLLLFALGSRLTAAEPAPNNKPIPAKEAAGKMTLPDGFTATLFAGEPDIVQPIAFTFDDRGRMWVVECLSYPKWSKDGKGSDRVVILEDTDGNGTFDKKTVFLDNGVNLSGIEIGFGGVWLCSSPNLLFVPILEGDKPGKPEVKLDGWNMIDTKHNIFNSLVWGPDGWLYGCNGIQAKAWVGAPGTPKDKRTYLDCGVWRYHPTRNTFEAVAHGTTNPFGLDFDDYGELFITNCVIDHLFHFVPGGHYERMYGQDANPHVYGLMKSCVDYRHWAGGDWTTSRTTGVGGKPEHSDAGGGHAHSGAAIYLTDNFPAEYRNTLFTANIHGNRLNNDGLERTKSGYKGVRRKDFLFANDSWFRGICVKTGPEGGLYVSDWCDTGECHNYDTVDATNGRIYRVVYKGAKPWRGDVSKMTDDELVKLQSSTNDWFVRKARRVLQERAAAGKLVSQIETTRSLRAMMTNERDTPRKLRAIWAIHAVSQLTAGDVQALAKDSDPAIRIQAAVLALDDPEPSKMVREIVSFMGADEVPSVRRALAGQAHRLDGYYRLGLVSLLLKRPADPETALMLWYAIEPTVSTADLKELATLPNPLLTELAVRKLLSDSGTRTTNLTECVAVLSKVDSDAGRALILRGMRDSLSGAKVTALPPHWATVYADLMTSKTAEVRYLGDEVALILGDPRAVATLRARVSDTRTPTADRQTAIRLLAQRKLPDFAKTLHALLDDDALRGTAIRALAGFADADTPAAIIKAYPKFTALEKTDAVQTLAARAGFAKELLDAIEKGHIPRADVPVVTARQVLALNDKGISERLEKVWGKITPASKERVALMKKWKGVLTEDRLAKADVGHGRVLFAKHCASCHKMFGEGQAVGPELTGSQRTNLDYVLENVLDPSAVVPREYQMVNFTLADERVVGGIVLRETKDAITVRTVNDTLTIPTGDVLTRKQTPVSIMPEGLFDQMKPDEVRDLVAYLRAKEQVPLSKK